MTLIAAFLEGDVPLVLGDLLLTWEARSGDEPVPVPSQVSAYSGTDLRTVAGFGHKVVLIGELCAIGWSCTNQTTALEVIKQLRELEAEEKLSLDTLIECVTGHPRFDDHSLQIVGWIISGGLLCHIHIETRFREVEPFGVIAAGGSGATACLDLAEALAVEARIAESLGPPADANISGIAGISRALLLIAFFMAHEKGLGKDAHSLQNGYGGAYEIAYFDGTKFRFLEDYCIHSLWATLDDNGQIMLDIMASFRHSYIDGWLVIDCVHPGTNDVQMFVLSPPLFSGSLPDLKLFDVPRRKVKFQASAVDCLGPESSAHFGLVEFIGSDVEPQISVECPGSRIILRFDKVFLEKVISIARRELTSRA